MTKTIAYLGPIGTFTEQAALLYDSDADLMPLNSVLAIANAVDNGTVEEGVVPIENSLQGSVPDTLDLLIHDTALMISREIIIPIELCLMLKPDTKQQEVEVVYSHPNALGQCRKYLDEQYKNAIQIASLSTAAAVEDMLSSKKPAAAIGNTRTADIYGVKVLDRGIQDNKSNHTRFVVLSKTDHEPTGSDKTSLCFSFGEDQAGMLHSVLGYFAEKNINLAKVESRPNKAGLGEYVFLLDIEGHREDDNVMWAIEQMNNKVSFVKLFGSYPKHIY